MIDSIVTLDLPMGMMYNISAVATDNVGNTPSSSMTPDGSSIEVYFPEVQGEHEVNMFVEF